MPHKKVQTSDTAPMAIIPPQKSAFGGKSADKPDGRDVMEMIKHRPFRKMNYSK